MTHASIRVLESDPVPPDPVLGCLVALARRHRHLVDEDILAAGLPLASNGLLPKEEIPRAARRAGFLAEPAKRPLDAIAGNALPALLLLADDDACVLTAPRGKGYWEVLTAESAGPMIVPQSTLAARYTGRMVSLRRWERPTDDERLPADSAPPRPPMWQRYWPLALAAMPAEAVVLTLAALLPHFSHHWGKEPMMVAAAAAAALLLDGLLRGLRRWLVSRASRRSEMDLATRVFRQIIGRPQPNSIGAYAAALQAFLGERSSLFRNTVAAVAGLPFFAALWLCLVWRGGDLALPPLFAVPLFLGLGLALGPVADGAAHRRARDEAIRQGLLVESLASVESIRALGVEQRWEKAWTDRSAAVRRAALSATSIDTLARQLPHALEVLVLVGSAAWGARLVDSDRLQAASLAVCLLVTARVVAFMAGATRLLSHRRSVAAAFAEMNEMVPPAVEKPRTEPRLLRPELRDAIVFENLSFSYPQRPHQVLTNATLNIRPGERLAVAGAAGSGKTTTARLILGVLAPSDGHVLIDGREPAAEFAELRSLLGYLPQRDWVFAGTLRENLTLCQPGADEESVRQIAELVGIDELVETIGLDAPLPQRGETLSAGERQGIGLARILLADHAVLLLDDPCASWSDAALEQLVDRLRPTLIDRTVALFTDRRPLLSLADRVLRLEGGKFRPA